MDPERKGLVAAGLTAVFAALMGGALAATGAWRNALFLGAADAAAAAAGPGFYELLFNAVIPDKLAEAGAPAPLPPSGASMGDPTAMPADVAAALKAAKAAMDAADKLANCSGSECAAEAAAAAAAAQKAAAGATASGQAPDDGSAGEESNAERLRLIRMRERSARETKLYGGGTPTARPGKMSAADVEASFGGMIQRLKQRAGKDGAAPTVGGSESPGKAAAAGGGDDSPIMTQENQSDRLNSPTLRALQKLNKDSRHSVGMSRDGGTTDGSRDKAGKSFDGNRATFGAIPIAETTGAMGRKQIKAAEEPVPSDIQGQPVR